MPALGQVLRTDSDRIFQTILDPFVQLEFVQHLADFLRSVLVSDIIEEGLPPLIGKKPVKIIHRRDRFRGIKELQERVFKNEKITPVYDSIVTEICGKSSVDFVKITNTKTKKIDTIPCSAVFIFIGIVPNSGILKELIDTDDKGFILVDRYMKTSQTGIYACGDVVSKDLYQIANAVGEGATAAFSAQKHIEKLKNSIYT